MIRLRALVPEGHKRQEQPRPSTSRQFDDPVPGPSSAPQSQGETGDEENRSSPRPPAIIDIIQVEEGETIEDRNNPGIRDRLPRTPARRRRNQRKSRLAKKRHR